MHNAHIINYLPISQFIMVFNWKKIKEILIQRKGLGTIASSDILGSAITAIFWFFLASVIKPDEYGEIFYIISIASIAFSLSNVGTENNTIVFTAKRKNLEPTLTTISLLFGTVSSLVLIIIFYQTDIIILLFGYIINSLSLGYLIGRRFYSKYGIFLLSQKILTVILGVSFFYLFGADGIISALGISYFGFLIIIINYYRKTPLNFQGFKKNLPFILHNYSLKAIGIFKGNVDKLIIVPLIGFSFLGNYALALQFVAVLSIGNSFFSKYLLTNDSRDVPNKILKKYYMLLNICVAISASISLPIVVPYFFPEFTDISILGIMCLAVIPIGIITVQTSELLGHEMGKPNVIGAIIASTIAILGMLLLVPLIGATGAAIVFLLSPTGQAAYLTFYVRKWKKNME